jgi:aminoglycoside phosphotransferase (APT) family kinase protein
MSTSAATVQLTDSQINPLASAVLNGELPGLKSAFDEQAMRDYLQTALFGGAHARYAIDACEVEQATYLEGPGCLVRYQLAIADTGGQPFNTLVSGLLFSTPTACRDYVADRLEPAAQLLAGRADIAPFAQPVAAIEALRMAVFVFPIDADLAELAAVTDEGRMRAAFSIALPAAQARVFEVAECPVELVDYGRARRATLRYHVRGPSQRGGTFEQVVYGKLTGDGSGAMAESIISALRQRLLLRPASERFAVPDVFAWLPDTQLSLLEAIPGESMIGDMVKGRVRGKVDPQGVPSLESVVETCARIAATLHTSNIPLGPRRTLDDELAALRRSLVEIQRVSPLLAAEIEPRIERLSAKAARSEALPLRFNHGDFTHGQVLIDGERVGLIDFDSVCQAEPALDIGQFLTYLRLAGTKSKLSPEATEAALNELAERFIGAYLDAVDGYSGDAALLRARVALYRKVSMLRRIGRSWLKFKANRIAGAIEVLDQLDT